MKKIKLRQKGGYKMDVKNVKIKPSIKRVKTITFNVKRKWFEQIRAGTKKEELRLVKKYWADRLIDRHYDEVVIRLGYKSGDENELRFKYNGYTVKTIVHEEFGNKPVMVFAIDLSEVIK